MFTRPWKISFPLYRRLRKTSSCSTTNAWDSSSRRPRWSSIAVFQVKVTKEETMTRRMLRLITRSSRLPRALSVNGSVSTQERATSAPAANPAAQPWSLPRTPDGQTDIQGMWNPGDWGRPLELRARRGESCDASWRRSAQRRRLERRQDDERSNPHYCRPARRQDPWLRRPSRPRNTSRTTRGPMDRRPALPRPCVQAAALRRAPDQLAESVQRISDSSTSGNGGDLLRAGSPVSA